MESWPFVYHEMNVISDIPCLSICLLIRLLENTHIHENLSQTFEIRYLALYFLDRIDGQFSRSDILVSTRNLISFIPDPRETIVRCRMLKRDSFHKTSWSYAFSSKCLYFRDDIFSIYVCKSDFEFCLHGELV